MMRIATKYPRIAERHFESTGRQVEVIEVKGSVELAPLIGLADGIVDLVATGRTLEENDLEVREEIVECTARFVANRVAHKLRGARGGRADRAAARGERRDEGEAIRVGGPARTAGEIRAWASRATPRVDVDQIQREVREGGDGAVLRLTARLDATEKPPSSLRVEPSALTGGAGRARLRGARVARAGGRQHPGGRRGAGSTPGSAASACHRVRR